jgi:hypothetical protein
MSQQTVLTVYQYDAKTYFVYNPDKKTILDMVHSVSPYINYFEAKWS